MEHRACAAALSLFLVMALAGCTTNYEQTDIYKYVKKTYALGNVKVSNERVEFTGEDGYVDYIWGVIADDITFHVKDDYRWDLETLSNSLTDDYRDVMLKAYYDQCMPPHLTLDEGEEEGLYSNRLIGTFDSKEELRQLYDELVDFQVYTARRGYRAPYSFRYHLLMQSPLCGDTAQDSAIPYEGDSIGYVTEIRYDTVKEAMKEYAQTYTEYHFSDLYDKFDKAEIVEALSDSEYRLGIVKEGDTFFYDDLCAGGWNKISFGTLYEILQREGFAVEGNNERYSFTDADRNTYEISYVPYDLIDADGSANESDHASFLKNGSPAEREYRFNNHLAIEEIEEISGLKLYIEARL